MYKKSVRTSNNLYGLYDVQKSKIQTITRLNLLQFAVQVRTSTDRTGCTNFFREKIHFLRAGVDKRLDAHKAPHPAPTGQVDVVGGFKVIAAVVLSQFGAETDRRYAVTGVVLAPLLVNVVELLGADGVVRLEAEVAFGLHEVDDIVAAALDGVHVGGGSFADREAEVVLHQPVQPFQTPQQDAFQLGTHLFDKERVIHAVGGLVLGGQDELTAKEAVRMVVQRGQRTVAKAEEPGVNVPLVALDALTFQVQLGLGGHDGLDIVGFWQGVHVHVIVDHE